MRRRDLLKAPMLALPLARSAAPGVVADDPIAVVALELEVVRARAENFRHALGRLSKGCLRETRETVQSLYTEAVAATARTEAELCRLTRSRPGLAVAVGERVYPDEPPQLPLHLEYEPPAEEEEDTDE